jgi:cytochrome c551/c552
MFILPGITMKVAPATFMISHNHEICLCGHGTTALIVSPGYKKMAAAISGSRQQRNSALVIDQWLLAAGTSSLPG